MPTEPDNQGCGLLTRVVTRAIAVARRAWSVFWKVTLAATLTLFFAYVAVHYDDFRTLNLQKVWGAVYVLSHCLVCGVWVGAAAGLFAAAWRLWGAWILIPMLGALAGAVGSVSLTVLLLSQVELPSPDGLHGAANLIALAVLCCFALIAAIGAVLGGTITAISLWLIAFAWR